MKNARKPMSTPLKPVKASESKPAVMSTMATPRMPLGTSASSSCSRNPAKTTKARAKPIAVDQAYTTLCSRLNSF